MRPSPTAPRHVTHMASSVRCILIGMIALLPSLCGCTDKAINTGGVVECKNLEDYLPTKPLSVDVMTMAAPARLDELVTKIKQNASENPEYWGNLKTPGGQPLPYDRRMGISEDEYKELFALFDTLELRTLKTVRLNIARKNDIVSFDGGDILPELNGVEFDLRTCGLTTRYGQTSMHDSVVASEDQKLTGPWNGMEWTLKSVNPRFTVRLSLGKHVKTGRGILYYNYGNAPRAANESGLCFLFFDKE